MRLALLLVSWSIAATASSATLRGQTRAPAPPGLQLGLGAPVEGLVLLKNGELLSGSVSRAGDYLLVVGENSELQIRTADVEAVCRDLEEVLERKRSKLNHGSAEEHLDLAQWCIDRKLYGPAARELTEAYRIDDLHPRIPLLERRMKAAMMPTKAAVAPVAKPRPAVDEEQVNAVVKGIGPEALHDFTIRVQPLLMNYCATAGCHGPKAASTFRLERVYLNERNDPRSVKRNLYATLEQVDRRSPSSSKLLTMPLAAHGGRSTPIFNVHNAEHYRQLAVWVQRVVGLEKNPPPVEAAAAATMPQQLLQRVPLVAPSGAVETGATSVSPPEPTPAGEPLAPVASKTTTSALGVGPRSVLPANTPAVSPVVDPFDPAEFNRGGANTAAAPK